MYNYRRIAKLPHHVDPRPAHLPAIVISFPPPAEVQTASLPPPPPLHLQAGDTHIRDQLHTIQVQLQALTIHAAQENVPSDADDEDDDMMGDHVDYYLLEVTK